MRRTIAVLAAVMLATAAQVPTVAEASMPLCNSLPYNHFLGNGMTLTGLKGAYTEIERLGKHLCTQQPTRYGSWSLSWVSLQGPGRSDGTNNIFQTGFRSSTPTTSACHEGTLCGADGRDCGRGLCRRWRGGHRLPRASTISPTTRPDISLAPVTGGVDLNNLAPVSASHPSAEAAEVLALCRIGDFIPIDDVAGMAEVPTAQDLSHYVPMTGREQYLKQSGPIWVIQIKGDIQMRYGVWTDPICFVANGEHGFVATGQTKDYITGKISQPEPPAVAPDRSLPPLAP